MFIHVYVMDKWVWISLWFSMAQVVGVSVDNLIKCIMDSLLNEGGLGENEIASKLVIFGVNDASVFQGH